MADDGDMRHLGSYTTNELVTPRLAQTCSVSLLITESGVFELRKLMVELLDFGCTCDRLQSTDKIVYYKSERKQNSAGKHRKHYPRNQEISLNTSSPASNEVRNSSKVQLPISIMFGMRQL